MKPVNVHGTAIVIGTTGLLFTGPSGSGKTAAALDCLEAARHANLFQALVSDDQVMMSLAGGRIIARPPQFIAGLAEIRGAGITGVEHVEAAVLSFAIMPVSPPFDVRMAPEDEKWSDPSGRFSLPLIRLPLGAGSIFGRLLMLLPQIAQS